MDEWVEVGPLHVMAELAPQRVNRGALGAFAVRVGDTVRAYSEVCPHREYGAVSQGAWDKGVLTCPLHFWRFDIASGRCLSGDSALESLDTRIERGVVWVRIPDRTPLTPAQIARLHARGEL